MTPETATSTAQKVSIPPDVDWSKWPGVLDAHAIKSGYPKFPAMSEYGMRYAKGEISRLKFIPTAKNEIVLHDADIAGLMRLNDFYASPTPENYAKVMEFPTPATAFFRTLTHPLKSAGSLGFMTGTDTPAGPSDVFTAEYLRYRDLLDIENEQKTQLRNGLILTGIIILVGGIAYFTKGKTS